MSTVTDNDLRELKDLINSKFEQVDRRLDKLDNKIEKLSADVNTKIEKLSADVNSIKVDIATLKEGQNGINKRLDNLDFIARTVIGGVVLALLAGLAKLLYPNLIN